MDNKEILPVEYDQMQVFYNEYNPLLKCAKSRMKKSFKWFEMSADLFLKGLLSRQQKATHYAGRIEIRSISIVIDGKPLPDDVEVDSIGYNAMSNNVVIRLWSSQWEEIKERLEIPKSDVQVMEHIHVLIPAAKE